MIYKFIYIAMAIAHIACTAPLGKAVTGGQLFQSFNLQADFSYHFSLAMLTFANFVLIYEVYKIAVKRKDPRLIILYVDLLPMIVGVFVGMYLL